jgi:hypothetical protein
MLEMVAWLAERVDLMSMLSVEINCKDSSMLPSCSVSKSTLSSLMVMVESFLGGMVASTLRKNVYKTGLTSQLFTK